MKQNSSASEILTKQDLIDALKDFRTVTKQDIDNALKDFRTVTKQDIDNALKDFRTVTKQDIDNALKDFRKEINDDTTKAIATSEVRMLTKMDEMEFRIEDRARERHSEVLTKFDGWAGELEKAQHDRDFNAHQLNTHEERISTLEKTQN